ncbi:BgTH12-04842 [Blumeria graminis f. sp. triticale]|uniref:BgtA-20275 n=3 Tax=Blumeria graminis TaxID=34373 RepID=A0A9X9L8H8_BLUGR|nr:hypothetical protein BGT96224_A20275 [Blumeria graminis f. sp. tritici 96224]CAD6499190.1 BgTH12-04842 [Blumeria graminis f. sp. triticale]VCU39306.1 BgtA-20275 [Blumeria graminis f. sp. tritici]
MSSGRLQGFVQRGGRAGSPFTTDRKAAQNLKFPPRPPSAAPAPPNYSSVGGAPNTHVSQSFTRPTPASPGPFNDGFPSRALDSSVDSDFDRTKTDLAGHDAYGVSPVAADPWDAAAAYVSSPADSLPEPVRYLASRPPSEPAPLRGPKTGRFQARDSHSLEMRLSPGEPKRPHSDPGLSDPDPEADAALRAPDTPRSPTPTRAKLSRITKPVVAAGSPQHLAHVSADYDDEALQRMTYAELEAQTWEEAAPRKPFVYPRELRAPGTPLESKINYYLAAAPPTPGAAAKAAEAFFEQLSSPEWDEAGEIFMDKFSALMRQLQAKRREKRRIAEAYEREVKQRERSIRHRTLRLEQKLQKMRASGESMLGAPRDTSSKIAATKGN